MWHFFPKRGSPLHHENFYTWRTRDLGMSRYLSAIVLILIGEILETKYLFIFTINIKILPTQNMAHNMTSVLLLHKFHRQNKMNHSNLCSRWYSGGIIHRQFHYTSCSGLWFDRLRGCRLINEQRRTYEDAANEEFDAIDLPGQKESTERCKDNRHGTGEILVDVVQVFQHEGCRGSASSENHYHPTHQRVVPDKQKPRDGKTDSSFFITPVLSSY